jgi:hypothetical protein
MAKMPGKKAQREQIFVGSLADYLRGGINRFGQPVLITPVRFRSLARDTLPGNVVKRVAVARGKGLTWMSDAQFLKHLGPLGNQLRRVREGAWSRACDRAQSS